VSQSSPGSPELLPCPLCGKPPGVEMTGFHMGARTIRCETYDCMGPHTTAENMDDATIQWNRRSGGGAQAQLDRDDLAAMFLRMWKDGSSPLQIADAMQSRGVAQGALDPSRDELIASIRQAAQMISEHIEEHHDFDYQPHEVPLELQALRNVQHHLEGSLIDAKGETMAVSSTEGK
jgi:hypothetical protein